MCFRSSQQQGEQDKKAAAADQGEDKKATAAVTRQDVAMQEANTSAADVTMRDAPRTEFETDEKQTETSRQAASGTDHAAAPFADLDDFEAEAAREGARRFQEERQRLRASKKYLCNCCLHCT